MNRFVGRLSAPAFGAGVGVVIGVIDSFLNGQWSLDPLAIIWVWTTIGCACGLFALLQRLAKFSLAAIAFAVPGLLILSRAVIPIKEQTGWSTSVVMLLWVLATGVIAIAFSFVRVAPSRHPIVYAAAVVVSVCGIVYAAADVRAADLNSRNRSSASSARNVVLIFLDTLRSDEAFGGTSPAMPKLARFATTALSFDNAWAPAPWTVPSHFAVLTGADWWRVPASQSSFQYPGPRLAEEFRAHGYETAAIFANPILRTDRGFRKGFDEFTVSRASGVCRSGIGELVYLSSLISGPRAPLCEPFTGSEVNARALRFVQRARQPYFLAINYFDAHDPYYVPSECRTPGFHNVTVAERRMWRRAVTAMHAPDAEVIARTHAQYHAAMACLDQSLGALIDTLQQQANTVIAVVGDHGEEFFEHGRGAHGSNLYREVLQVPLILRAPGLAPQRVTDPVSTTDLHLSLLRAAGFARADASLPLLDPAQRREVLSTYELLRTPNDPSPERAFSIASGNLEFIYWRGGREALFDYRSDPAEKSPLKTATPALAESMRESTVHALRDEQRALPFNALGYMR